MADALEGPRSRLEEKLGAQKLGERMEELRRETGGLLDGRAILALLADELGLAETGLSTLAELDPSHPVYTRCVVEAIDLPRDFQGRDRAGKLRKLKVADSSGKMVLTLWDEETGLVEQLGLRAGSSVRILSATLRETRYGREIHVGRTGFVIAESAPLDDGPSERQNINDLGKAAGKVDVKGVILSLNTTGRGRQKLTTIRLFDGTGECDVSVPHDRLSPPDGLDQGVEIEVLSARAERSNDHFTLHCDSRSCLKII